MGLGTLIVKTKVEAFTTVEGLDVFIDDVDLKKGKVYIKITNPKFQHILVLSTYEFEKLIQQYDTMKAGKKRTCPIWKYCRQYEAIECEGFNEKTCDIYKRYLKYREQGLSEEEASKKAIEEFLDYIEEYEPPYW